MLMRKSIGLVSLIVLALVISACSLFGSSSESIPPGKSDVLGVIRYIDDFTGEGLDVELAGETTTAGEGGTFAFTDVENDRYMLKIYRNDTLVDERDLVVKEDIANLVIELGDNLFSNLSFEDPIDDPFPSSPGNRSSGWNANRALDGKGNFKEHEVTVDDTVARTGSRSVKFHGERVDGTMFPGTLRHYGTEMIGGATYRLTAYFKTDPPIIDDSNDSIYFRLRFYPVGQTAASSTIVLTDIVDDMIVAPESPYYEGKSNFLYVYPESYDDEWNRLYVEFIMPEGTDDVLLEATYAETWDGLESATLWWDDITLIRVE